MLKVTPKELVEAGIHFGHKTSRWNPKMKPYIFGKRKNIHIVDLRQTLRSVVRAHHFLRKEAAKGGAFLFVGTKRQARTIVEAEAKRAESFYAADRWIGGTLTNLEVIRRRIKRLEELEYLEDSGQMNNFSKKVISTLMREKRKITRNLQGIREMNKIPSALIIIDPRHEHNALAEARKLDVPVIALVDTDSDPEDIDIVIPGNDDAMRSIEIVCSKLADAILAGRAERVQVQMAAQDKKEAVPAAPARAVEEGETKEENAAPVPDAAPVPVEAPLPVAEPVVESDAPGEVTEVTEVKEVAEETRDA